MRDETEIQVSIITPCFNEEKNISEFIERTEEMLQKRSLIGEIIVINDASTDNTKTAVEKLCKKYENVKLLNHEKNWGIASAWKTGLIESRGEYIALIDCDLQYAPEDIFRLYRETKINLYDIAQGRRSTIGRVKVARPFLNRILNFIVRRSFGVHLHDPISSFLVCRREILDDLFGYKRFYYFFPIILMAAAVRKGYHVREVEILFEKRLVGKDDFVRFFDTATKSLHDIAQAFIEFRVLHKTETITHRFLKSHRISRMDPELPFLRRMLFKIFINTMPLHHWMISRQAGNYYKELKKSQWLSLAHMKELQARKLRRIIHHAYYHVPYYRTIFDEHKIKPKDIKTIEDLQKIPYLTKQDVRENLYFDLFSDNHEKKHVLRVSTSGSTGEPFICYADKHQLEIRWASTLRSAEWTGYRFGDRQARLWHQTLGMSFTQVVREKLDAIFNRRLFIPAFELSDKNINAFVEKIKKFKPVLIDGYAESFNFLAQYLKQNDLKGLKLKGIISSAQELPDHSRKIIEEKFGCKVFDKYGSREFSGIAYECDAHQGHHVVSESYVVEIIKDNRPAKSGEVGEVVITDLNNMCMPMIRYRVGDIATAMDNNVTCPCGRGMPRIGKIEGRIQAIIIGSDGQYIPGTFFAHFFKDHDHIIRQYQISQETLGKIGLKIVKGSRFDDDVLQKIISELKKYVGQELEIEIECVEKIPMVRTGKHQGSISKIKIDFQKDGPNLLNKK